MTTWITDINGNRCSVEYFGSEAAARAALNSLDDCTDCTNSSDCTRCARCTRCTRASFCTNCTDCKDCHNIRHAESSWVVGPTRTDGYQFVMTKTGTVHAGCRAFPDIASARDHWTRTRGGTQLGDETMRILDYLEVEWAARAPAKVE